MNLMVITGRMYNGAVHGWTDNQKEERSCYRGRLNFRLPNGDYAWMDAVCFKDNPNTTQNGLVGWLEDNYLAPEDESDGHGGRAIEVTGWLKPATKKKTVTVKLKGGAKKDIPNVPYDTFELVIETASFVPTNHGEGGGARNGVEVDDDDFDVDDDAVEDEIDDEEDDAPPARRNSKDRSSGSNSRQRSSSSSSNSRTDRRSGGSSSKSNSNSRTDRRSGSASGKSNSGSNRGGSSRTGGSSSKKKKDDDFFVED